MIQQNCDPVIDALALIYEFSLPNNQHDAKITTFEYV